MPPGIGYGRKAPKKRAPIPTPSPVDTTGMDPEMRATLKHETERRDVFSKMFGPFGTLIKRKKK